MNSNRALDDLMHTLYLSGVFHPRTISIKGIYHKRILHDRFLKKGQDEWGKETIL